MKKPKSVAIIYESLCIGCTLCREACPFDAIIGAQQYMHTVIKSECPGCGLCISPCPVNCITLKTIENNSQTNYTERAKLRIERLKNEKLLSQNQYEEQKKVILDGGSEIIEEVIDRLKKNKKDTRI